MEDILHFGRFGKVHIYTPTMQPSHIALFVSGDGGWNQGVMNMANDLTTLDTLVAGIDILQYRRLLKRSHSRCDYLPGDFEDLSKFVQKTMRLKTYITPVLIGYSSGATLVYAALAQAPPNTFAGAVSMGFCFDLRHSEPLCKGNGLTWEQPDKNRGLYNLLPAKDLMAPWIVLQGLNDRVCEASVTEEYVKQIPRGKILLFPRVGHGFAKENRWMPQLREAYTQLFATQPSIQPTTKSASAPLSQLKNLPLVEVPSREPAKDILAVIVTGDGGWASIDRQIGTYLAQKGVPVVGLNSLQYFWTRRNPAGAAQDLAKILRYYLAAWKKNNAILVGYSLGADVLPFMADRLPPDLSKKIKLIAILGPDTSVDFEFHLTDWIPSVTRKGQFSVLPELEKLTANKLLCFYGQDERSSVCKSLKQNTFERIELKGGHHFDNDYKPIAARILQESCDAGGASVTASAALVPSKISP
jgi:type IV secretory pathway VirJ component